MSSEKSTAGGECVSAPTEMRSTPVFATARTLRSAPVRAASFAFMLPVATPPNAVVFGSGCLSIKQMARAGLWLNLIGAVLIVIFVRYLMPVLWGIELGALPAWAAGR